MSTQLLFYERVTPVSIQRHGQWGIEPTQDYGFARNVNSVPLMAIEFGPAMRDYPIVFAGQGEGLMPIVLLGTQQDRNAMVAADGSWTADYIPAFVRRYPFVFSQGKDDGTFTLCVDEKWIGCNDSGGGQRLFDDDGAQSPYLERVVGFLRDYQGQFLRTQAYCQKLVEFDLLEPMQAEFSIGAEEKRALTGFSAVSRDRLKALAPERLAELAANDELELTYIHLASMQNVGRLVRRADVEDTDVERADAPQQAAAPEEDIDAVEPQFEESVEESEPRH